MLTVIVAMVWARPDLAKVPSTPEERPLGVGALADPPCLSVYTLVQG
jgi:hypothetical protein